MISKIIQDLVLASHNWLVPPQCPSCQQPVKNGPHLLCPICWLSIGAIGQHTCRHCGLLLVEHEKSQNACGPCQFNGLSSFSSHSWKQSLSLLEATPLSHTLLSLFVNGDSLLLLPFFENALTRFLQTSFPKINHLCLLDKTASPSLIHLVHGVSKRLGAIYIKSCPLKVEENDFTKTIYLSIQWMPTPFPREQNLVSLLPSF